MQFLGSGIYTFIAEEKMITYISDISNNMIPYRIAIVEINSFLSYGDFDFIKNEKNKTGTLLSSTSRSLDPHDYHVSKCGKDSFMKTEIEKNSVYVIGGNDDDTCQDNSDNENESQVDPADVEGCNGTNELVKFLQSKLCYLLGAPKRLCISPMWRTSVFYVRALTVLWV